MVNLPLFASSVIGYVGPGDLVDGARVWYGLRAYSISSIGTKAVRLRRDSDSAEQDFVTLGNGNLDVGSIVVFKGIGKVYVSKWYDQSGNGIDLVQTATSQQPELLVSGGIGNKPAVNFVHASSTWMFTATPITSGDGDSFSFVCKSTNIGAQQTVFVLLSGSNTPSVSFDVVLADVVYVSNGAGQNVPCADGATHAIQGTFNRASSVTMVDGTSTTLPADQGSGTNTQILRVGVAITDFLNGPLYEFGIWKRVFTSAQMTSLNTNQNNYWSYLGPGDIVPAAAGWWGLRAYSKAKVNTKAVRVRRDSDNNEQDINTLPFGDLDTVSLSNFKGAANLFVSKWYDQSGNGNDMAQAVAVSQPAFTMNLLNGHPVIDVTSGSVGLTCVNSMSSSAPFIASMLFNMSVGTGGLYFYDNTGNDTRIRPHVDWFTTDAFATPAHGMVPQIDAVTVPPDKAWNPIQWLANGAGSSSILRTAGFSITGNCGPNGFGPGAPVLFSAGAQFVGYSVEFGLWSGNYSDQFGTVEGNQTQYWGLLDNATQVWVNAVVANGGTVSAGRQVLVDNLIKGLKADGIFSKLDRLWLFAGENAASALTDIIADQLATNVSSTTFTTDRGYTGNGSSMYIDSNFNPATAPTPRFTRNSASLFGWNNTAATATGPLVGQSAPAASFNRLYTKFTSTNLSYWYINADGSSNHNISTLTPDRGLWLINRTDSSSSTLSVNAAQVDTSTDASVAPGSVTLTALLDGSFGNYSDGQSSCLGIGASLSRTEITNLYNRLRTYMTAVGVP